MDYADSMAVPTSTSISPRKFTYDTLRDPKTQLRLLSIEPGEWSAPLRVTLQTFDYEEILKTPYAAISYTWGDPTSMQSIYVNGTVVDVRYNCYYTLVQARYHQKRRPRDPLLDLGSFVQRDYLERRRQVGDFLVNLPRLDPQPLHIWIDSICINQDNIAEKSIQVAKMGAIFREAETVFCCVGPHDGDSAWLCQQLEWFRAYRRSKYIYDTTFLDIRHLFEQAILTPYANLHRFVTAYNRFCDRPYWNRIWTLQEMVSSQRGEIWCGTAIPDLQLLMLIGSHCIYSSNRGAPGFQQEIAMLDKCLNLNGIAHTRKSAAGFFSMLSSKQCSDPRDLFYGSMSLSGLLLTPDYTKLPCEVAHEAIYEYLVQHGKYLGVDFSRDDDSRDELHDSVSGVLERMGITAGNKTFAMEIQERSGHDERPELNADRSVDYRKFPTSCMLALDRTVRRLSSNLSNRLVLDGSEIRPGHPDTLRCVHAFRERKESLIKSDCKTVDNQSIFARDGAWLGVTSSFTRPGDFLIRHGSFDLNGLKMKRYLVIRPSNMFLSECDVVGQAATLALVHLQSPTIYSLSGGIMVFIPPEDLIVYYVQSLIPPEWKDIDWICSCVATRFSGPNRVPYASLSGRKNVTSASAHQAGQLSGPSDEAELC